MLLVALSTVIGSMGQFVNVSAANSINFTSSNPFHGNGCAFVDFDDDGWDDLTYVQRNAAVRFLKNYNGSYQNVALSFDPALPNTADGKMPLWFDYDNDGDKDFFVSYSMAPVRLYRNNGNLTFTEVTASSGLIAESARQMGAAACDIDRDGDLDLFICKYHNHLIDSGALFANRLYRNNGDGTFTEATSAVGIPYTVQASFMPVFFDYDADGWPDLYVINDKIVYPNFLYHNNGDGTFTDVTVASGTGVYIEAMSITVEDYDHDSDFDILVTNTYSENVLLQNQGDGTFDDVAVETGLYEYDVTTSTWGALFLDYDNNTWDDLFMGTLGTSFSLTQQCDFFLNNNGQDFTFNPGAAGLNGVVAASYTSAMGDMNNDGFFDFINNNAAPSPSALFKNLGGNNHWIGMTVEGTLSNRDGIGTLLELWSNGQKYLRYTLSGENYMCQNSEKEIFGLGTGTEADSLHIVWPSGIDEWYYDLEVDQYHHFVEGASFSELVIPLTVTGSTTLCPGASAVLSAGEEVALVWSNGASGTSITVAEPGVYWASYENVFGYMVYTDTIEVFEAVLPNLQVSTVQVSCYGSADGSASVGSTGTALNGIVWSNASTDFTATGLGVGDYGFTVTYGESCTLEGSVLISQPDSLGFTLQTNNVSCYAQADGHALADSVFGGTPPYSFDWGGADASALAAGVYAVTLTDAAGCTDTRTFEIMEPEALACTVSTSPFFENGEAGSASVQISGGTPPYTVAWSNGITGDLTIDGLAPAFYSVLVIDTLSCADTVDFLVDFVQGINDRDEAQFYLFPNPADQTLNAFSASPSRLLLYDVTGKLAWEQPVSGSCRLDVSMLRAGLYIVRFQIDDQVTRIQPKPLLITH